MNLRALPKIDLHRHLEGSIRFETFEELARETGLRLPRRELRRRTCMRGEKPGFPRFLSKFELYRGLYPSRGWIERVAFEAAEDAKRDGIVYLELRFSPAHFARRMRARGEDVAEWVARGARRAGIDVRFIATFGRHFSRAENGPTFRAVSGTSVFSGLDLAGDESRGAAPFAAFFRRSRLPLTLHAGEAGGARNVREAMRRFGAMRIGHGVRVLEDERVVDEARRRGVAFEVCLTSELQTGAAKSRWTHPAIRMRDAGLRVTLNTDDPAICGISLSDEFRLARSLGFSRSDLSSCLRAAADAAFAGRSTRERLRRRIARAWGPVDTRKDGG